MRNFIFVDSCESTQDLLKEQLKQNNFDELTVGCEKQTNGHGRGENSWNDMPGSICFSMTVAPSEKVTFTALEISLLIQKFFATKGKAISVKWPNDLIADSQKKCGGVLIQNQGQRYLAGIGINLYSNNEKFAGVFNCEFDIDKKMWIKEISEFITLNHYSSTDQLNSDWLKQCFHLNEKVKVSEGEVETVGTFIGLGEHGEAILKNEKGLHHLFNGSLRLV